MVTHNAEFVDRSTGIVRARGGNVVKFQALKNVRLTGARLLFCLILPVQVAADVVGISGDRAPGDFEIKGVALGMDLKRVLEIYPEARISRTEADCYRFGQPIRVPELTSHIVRVKRQSGDLVMHFDSSSRGGGLSRIRLDQPVDPLTFKIDAVVERLTTHYGAYDRVLLRRKMEPAGRDIGFEWRRENRATLRIELRNDYSYPADSLRLSFLAKSSTVGQHQARRAPSQLCGSLWPGS